MSASIERGIESAGGSDREEERNVPGDDNAGNGAPPPAHTPVDVPRDQHTPECAIHGTEPLPEGIVERVCNCGAAAAPAGQADPSKTAKDDPMQIAFDWPHRLVRFPFVVPEGSGFRSAPDAEHPNGTDVAPGTVLPMLLTFAMVKGAASQIMHREALEEEALAEAAENAANDGILVDALGRKIDRNAPRPKVIGAHGMPRGMRRGRH